MSSTAPMTYDPTSRLMYAFQKHQTGDIREAERVYREILQYDPNHLDACQLLGAALVQDDRAAEAMPHIRKAISIRPDVAQYHVNLGTAHSRCGDLHSAVESYRRALRLQPQNFDAHRNLGSVLNKLRLFADAIVHLRQALDINPESIEVRQSLGGALLKEKRHEEAVPLFEYILQRMPHHRHALAGLGQALMHDPKPVARAIDCWEKLAVLDPDNPAIHNNLGTILKNAKRLPEAEAACRRALELRPGFFPALCNLGMIVGADGRFAEARDILEQAVAMDPSARANSPSGDADWGSADSGGADSSGQSDPNPLTAEEGSLERSESGQALIDDDMWREFGCVANCQLASIHNVLGNRIKAHEAVDRALAMDPRDPDSHMMRGFLHLAWGEFEKGWPDYEWRKKSKQSPRKLPGPEWTGESLPGKTILLHAEQGLGDTIQFVRYLRLVKERVGRILLLPHRSLMPLLRSSPYVDEMVRDGDPLPPYDVQLALLSLPGVFRTSLETVPAEVPYLKADPELVTAWRSRLAHLKGLKVGIGWQGNRDFAFDRYRSVPLQHFRRLAEIPGVHLISLQQGDGTEQLKEIDFEVHSFPGVDTSAGAFMDTAAIMCQLDLVISTCTATPHLAGALGVPVWLAKSFAAEWRWMADDREKNPWYPTMRMFRQPALGQWEPVFDRLNVELEALVDARRAKSGGVSVIPVELSPGELLDKLTILQIKLERITDAQKLSHVRYECDQLTATLQLHVSMTPKLEQLVRQLRDVNQRLWDVEDAIRDCERNQQFGDRFIELARSVYFSNDRRSEIKREINVLLGSALIEEKSYTEYERLR